MFILSVCKCGETQGSNKCGFSLNVDIQTRNYDTHTRTWPLILRLKALINLPALSLPTHAM